MKRRLTLDVVLVARFRVLDVHHIIRTRVQSQRELLVSHSLPTPLPRPTVNVAGTVSLAVSVVAPRFQSIGIPSTGLHHKRPTLSDGQFAASTTHMMNSVHGAIPP